jgi:glutaredoxin
MQITVYTTTWCPSCKMAKMYLASKGIAYSEVDIERTPGAAELVMKEASGCRTVPTIVIEAAGRREVVVDWNRRKLETVLEGLSREA